MEKVQLQAGLRTIAGRKVKTLRKSGLLPGNIYGKKTKSMAISIPLSDFEKVHKKVGETGIVELVIGKEARPVLIRNIQHEPLKGMAIHVDFFQVDLHEKVQAKVPVEIIGTAPAVTSKLGVLLTLLDEVEVEALPQDIPEKISVDVGSLSEVGAIIKVGDITNIAKVKLLTPGDREIIKVAPLVSKEAEKQAAEEEAAKAAQAAAAVPAAAEGAPAAGEAAAPQETKKEELKA